MTLFFLSTLGCNILEKGQQIELQSGTYQIDDIHIPGLGRYSMIEGAAEALTDFSLPDEIFEFEFTINTVSNTLDWGAGDLTTTNLIERPVEEWEIGCETDFTGVALQTFDFDPPELEIGSLRIESPYLHADDCLGLNSTTPSALLKESKADGYGFYLLLK